MTEWVPVIYGIGLDAAGRCQHYHLETDIAALWCRRCQRYYACYRCHDTLCQHTFVASAPTDLAVMCGACRYRMTVDRYHEGNARTVTGHLTRGVGCMTRFTF